MRRKRSGRHTAASEPRPAHHIYEEGSGKIPELARCPECDASYRDGRWTWESAPADAYEHVCPACQRIADDYPAGLLRVEGRFVATRRDELVGLLRNIEQRERAEHPLKRIMDVTDEDGGFVVRTTDAKLVEGFGRALAKAYDGRLEHPPTTSERQNLVRIRWSRDD